MERDSSACSFSTRVFLMISWISVIDCGWIIWIFFLFQIQLVVSSITIFIINICIWWNSTVYYSTKSRWMGWERDLLLILFKCVGHIHAGFFFNFFWWKREAEQSVTQVQSSLKPAFFEKKLFLKELS